MDKGTVELAVALHGHLALGLALGLRMSELALLGLGRKRGDRHLLAVSETARCLADAVQSATGCTPGHGNAFVDDCGKLALTVGDNRTKRGVRVALKETACKFSELMERWMMRSGKLSREEEDKLSRELLEMDERYFLIQDIEVNRVQGFESSAIARCSKCGELVPESLGVKRDGEVHCRACSGSTYYRLL